LKLEKHVALVLDVHHHWIRDEEYIQPNDDRVKRVIDSWRGVRPAMHYSYSRDHGLAMALQEGQDIDHSKLQDLPALLQAGAKKQKLRAHSDYFPNKDANTWALSFWKDFDIQCEAKAKNLASEQLYLQALSNT
jgi:UV DNA damage endonuclease